MGERNAPNVAIFASRLTRDNARTLLPIGLNRTEFRLVKNLSKNGKYNLILVDITRIELSVGGCIT